MCRDVVHMGASPGVAGMAAWHGTVGGDPDGYEPGLCPGCNGRQQLVIELPHQLGRRLHHPMSPA
jgi:hypothetical protein